VRSAAEGSRAGLRAAAQADRAAPQLDSEVLGMRGQAVERRSGYQAVSAAGFSFVCVLN